MEENTTLTLEWYRRSQVLRCVSLLPSEGMDKEMFIFCLDPDLQATARDCIRRRRYIVWDSNRIKPLSPSNMQPTEQQVIGFLGRLYTVLNDAVESHKVPDELSLEEKVDLIQDKVNKLRKAGNMTSAEEIFLEQADRLLVSLRFPRIGGLDHLKGEIIRLYNGASMFYFKRFGDERMDSLRTFHEEKGKSICGVFNKALDVIELQLQVQENILALMIEYYELTESMFEEIVVVGERLLSLMEKRKAETWELSWVHMVLSDGYLGTFKTNSDWLEKSSYHLGKACEYARMECGED